VVAKTPQRLSQVSRGGGSASPAAGGAGSAAFYLALPTYVIVVVLALAPLALLIVWSFWRYDPATYWIKPELSVDAYRTIVSSGRLQVIIKTTRIALTTTALALALSYPIAYYLHRLAGARLRTLLSLLFLVPFFTSYIVRTFAWRLILGRTGLVNTVLQSLGLIPRPLEWLLFDEFAVQVGLLASYLPFMIFPILLSMARIEGSILEASEDLGAQPWQTLRHVVIPLTTPGIFAGSLFVFVMALGSSVEVQFLGGAAESMIAIMITDVMRVLNFPLAFAISTLVLALLVLLLVLGNRYLGLSVLFRSVSR
jgi:ABC-type spermidine/putrescine transport system permease subunit I